MRDDLTHTYNDTNIKRISCNYLQYKNSDRLIAIYYVFDLEYTTMYAQMVGIIQHWVVGDAYTEQRCTNFIKFSDNIVYCYQQHYTI
jgi:hypothetical protein